MMEKSVDLTPGEWGVMECLWEQAPRSSMEAVEYLKESQGWAKSTTMTMLRRMAAKGLINCDESGPAKLYSPAIRREEAVRRETTHFLSRVYKGSVSLLLNTLTEQKQLSDEEIQALYAILEQAKEEGK